MLTIQDSLESSQIRIRDGTSRIKDEQGYLIIKDNPVAVAGVFPFLRSQISANDEGDDVVYVLRSEDSLRQAADMFRNKPIVHHHKWVGKGGERSNADGTIGSHVYYKDGALYSDLIIYNPDLIESIENGSCKQLSPGYNAVVNEQQGVYDGKEYTHTINYTGVNHLGVVEQGRAGSKLSIQDKQDKLMDTKHNASTNNRHTKRTTVHVADTTKMVKAADGQEKPQTQTQKNLGQKFKRIRDNNTVINQSKQRVNNGKMTQDDYRYIYNKKSKENRQLRDEINELKKVQAKILNDSTNERLYQERIEEIRKYLPEFKTYGEKRPEVLSRRAYEFYTGSKLADGMDARTAFLEAAKIPRSKYIKKKAVKDSKDEVTNNVSTLNKLCDLWR